MNKTLAFRSLCSKSILPAAAALIFAATGGSALASPQGQQAVINKLTASDIPTLKTIPTITKAKAADFITALSLALQDPANNGLTSAEIAAGALELFQGKYRTDKDKLAGQVIATTVAARGLSNNAAQIAAVTAAVFNVNSGDTKAHLTATGQANAVIGAVKAAGSASVGDDIGVSVAGVYNGDLAILLTNAVKGLGKTTTLSQGAVLAAYVNGTLSVKTGNANIGFIQGVADKTAAVNIVGTGALYGGLVANNPNGGFDSDSEIQALVNGAATDKKVTKALGEIVADSTGGVADRATLLGNAITALGSKPVATTEALLTQGVLRSAGNTATEINAILAKVTALDPSKYGATFVTSTGKDLTKVDAIVDNLAAKIGGDQKKQTAFGIAIINALALSNPAAAEVATKSIFDVAFADPASRQTFGLNSVGKIKTFAAAGYIAAAIVERDPVQSINQATLTASTLMAKGTKAANDIAQQVASLAVAGNDKPAFAAGLATAAPKFVQNVAVGVSLADPTEADLITVRSITHAGGLDTKATAKAATIASAVASVVDEEETAAIAQGVAAVMSPTGNTGKTPNTAKPIKLSLAGAMATGLAKALQTKPGVTTANRMDELGELAASMTKSVIGANGTDSKALTAEAKLITTIGSNILKALSKVPVLSGPNVPTGPVEANLVARTQTFKADLWEARDIAGSIAQTILASTTMTQAQKNLLLGTTPDANNPTSGHTAGTLEKAFFKLGGTKTSGTALAIIKAFDDVLHNLGGAKFEVGSDIDKETDNKNG